MEERQIVKHSEAAVHSYRQRSDSCRLCGKSYRLVNFKYSITECEENMVKTQKKYRLIFIVGIFVAMVACQQPTPLPATPSLQVTTTPSPTLANTPTIPTCLTPTESCPTPAAIPSQTPTVPTPSPTAPEIASLDWCGNARDKLCIGSFLKRGSKLYMILIKPSNQEDLHIFLDDVRYECAPITMFNDRYVCPKIQVSLNKTVFIQVFVNDSLFPLAEGSVYLDEGLFKSPSPPDPYQP